MARALALHESAVPVCRGLGFGVRVSGRAYASLVGLLGFWSRQLLSGSGNPRCAVDSASSAQLPLG